ncbi:MAG: peptidoglycan/LPS O-acetylase OafA/YrhL [Dinoroseobacter sp.]|jgi:peptidoglycan/LPS O-acetylase OafA/YrhL
MKYRRDIDGLRAIAILSVLVFHLDESFLSGGFVGVDIFFVISGFLITKLLVGEIQTTGGVSFKGFYVRRVRRLLPAMFFCFGFSAIGAYYSLSPLHLAEFGESLIYAIASLSNFFFWSSASYFDTQSQLKPLLHTWSLSIEEQFYMLWPALLLLLHRVLPKMGVLLAVLLLGVLSLWANIYFLENHEQLAASLALGEDKLDINSTVFYLLPFRVIEFVIGGALVWLPSADSRRTICSTAMCILGLLLIAYAMVAFNQLTPFPHAWALIPCIGAALLIYAGQRSYLYALLSNRVMVFFGLISYSLYLIHWPIIVFYRSWSQEPLSALDYWIIALASIALACLMYRYVEQPFRRPKQSATSVTERPYSNRPFVLSSIGLAGVMMLVGASMLVSKGWVWRYPADMVAQLSMSHDDFRKDFWINMRSHQGEFKASTKPKVLIIGDSMAGDLINSLIAAGADDKLDIATILIESNCKGLMPMSDAEYRRTIPSNKLKTCRAEHQKILDSKALGQADAVILASYWLGPNLLEPIKNTVAQLKRKGVPRVFVQGLKVHLVDGIAFFAKNAFENNNHHIRVQMNPVSLSQNHQLNKIEGDFQYFDFLPMLCDEKGCQRITENGDLIIFDGTHLTPAGTKFIGEKIPSQDWYQELISIND